MGFFSFFRNSSQGNGFTYSLVLDIGTEFLKTSIVEFNQEERNILGFAKVKQDYGNMDGGAITDIKGVVAKAKEALTIVSAQTPHRPKTMISGLAGEFVKGVLISQSISRKNPQKKIDNTELRELIAAGEKKAYQQAVKKTAEETGIKNVNLELINYAVVEIKVDGYKVNNPYEFQGSYLNLLLFYSFAPLVQLGAIRTIAKELGLSLLGIVAEPLAIANSFLFRETYEFGAIIIDIGGGTTDIALIRRGGIEGARMFAMGGRAFTRTLASNLRLSLQEAEELKLAYSRGEQVENYNTVERLIKGDLQLLYQGIEFALKDLAKGEALPRNIYFCGGGSALKGLLKGFKELDLFQRLPLIKEPEIKLLKGSMIEVINDETNKLRDVEHTTPRALCYYAATTAQKERSLMNLASQRL